MKTKILSFAVIALVLCSYFLAGNPGNTAEVKDKDQLVIGIKGPGQNVTNASVRLRSKQTGLDYYGTYNSPQAYTVKAPIDEDYTVYVCTNYPSHGSITLPANVGGIIVDLSTGMCPYGD
jgi:hypothetical protein